MEKLIDAQQIADRVEGLARSIAAELPPDLVMVVVMNGAMVFAADLMRALWREGARPRLETIRLSSYGAGKESSGEVRLIGEPPTNFRGRSVLLVDDIADSGRSLDWARGYLLKAGAADVRICALLDKSSRRVKSIPLDFAGFNVGDAFVVGYGVDHAEDHRYLPYIAVVD